MINTLKILFTPHEANNYKPKTLHLSSLSIFMIIIMISQLLLSILGKNIAGVLGIATNITPYQLIELTNQKREENGLPALKLDETLSQAAQLKGADMIAKNYWAHTSPDGKTPWVFLKEAGYQYLYAGENLARDFMDSQSIINAWMDSPTHRDNLLSSRYTDIGIAVINDTYQGQPTTLVIQHFGTKLGSVISKPTGSISQQAEALISQVTTSEEVAGFADKFPTLSSFRLTKAVSISLTAVLLAAIIIDTIIITKKKIIRLSGKGVAHLIFLGILLVILLTIKPGLVI